MAYCDLDYIRKKINGAELIRLTDEENTGEIDTTKVDDAIVSADVEIDAYLGQQDYLPLVSPPALIGDLSRTLAIRNLYQISPGGVPESREKDAANAIKLLDKIAKGELTLGFGDPQAGSTDNGVHFSSSQRIFSRGSLKGY